MPKAELPIRALPMIIQVSGGGGNAWNARKDLLLMKR